eukprot:gnl/MRDRNA2_/MRDRNA2_32961_c0_seq1.p1 gnl/MRDRNA2_/MRDRNA2_32961_c0~~gnl/MRDRNA2_/MRDRNA2_32961_c0_seq1.p1  ORF type:complete len:364 (+),score=63.08 gnl/MRDRNA2_/MRDRNA2_32961_c0_seq1:118-1092(+)
METESKSMKLDPKGKTVLHPAFDDVMPFDSDIQPTSKASNESNVEKRPEPKVLPSTFQAYMAHAYGVKTKLIQTLDADISRTRLNQGDQMIQVVQNITIVAALCLSIMVGVWITAPDQVLYFGVERLTEDNMDLQWTWSFFMYGTCSMISMVLLMNAVLGGLILLNILVKLDEAETRDFEQSIAVVEPIADMMTTGLLAMLGACVIWSYHVFSPYFAIPGVLVWVSAEWWLGLTLGKRIRAYYKVAGVVQKRISLKAAEVKKDLMEYVQLVGIEQVDLVDFEQFLLNKHDQMGRSLAHMTNERVTLIFRNFVKSHLQHESLEYD